MSHFVLPIWVAVLIWFVGFVGIFLGCARFNVDRGLAVPVSFLWPIMLPTFLVIQGLELVYERVRKRKEL